MIRLEKLSKAFGLKHVADSIDFQFPTQKRIALVGANGAGKTTLLNMICGIEEADDGIIEKPRDLSLGYLPQYPNDTPEKTVLLECMAGYEELFECKKEMDALTDVLSNDSKAVARYENLQAKFASLDGYALESKAASILSGLGFSEEQIHKSPLELSGGWRMRLELARIFVKPINFIVLDEPTNHLDLPALVWVENYLQNFPGTVVFVSHDRSLLNRLGNFTVYLSRGQLDSYPGNFDAYLEKREEKMQQAQAARDNLKKKREHMEAFVERFGAKATKAKQAQSRTKMISRLKSLEDDLGPAEATPDELSFRISPGSPSAREVVRFDALSIGYPDLPLAQNISALIEKGHKVAVIGANGIGKSTLLKTLVGEIPSLGGRVEIGAKTKLAYYSQDPEDLLDMQQTIIENVLAVSDRIGEPEARKILGAFLFRNDDVFKKVSVLSGGEKARVALSCLLLNEANFLVLDEPTNHLDMSSVEVLIEAINNYTGTLMFVSHDRNFIEAVCSHILVMLPDGRHHLFEGKIEDYQRMAKLIHFPDLFDLDNSSNSDRKLESVGSGGDKSKEEGKKNDHETAKALKSKRQTLTKRLSQLEKNQAKFEKEIKDIEAKMLEATNNYQKMQDLQNNLNDLQEKLEQTEEEWLEASASLEETEDDLRAMNRL